MKPYAPIRCDLHDVYEIAIMRNTPLQLNWHQQGEEFREVVQPIDTRCVDQAEWLIAARRDGEHVSIRLDWIDSAKAVQPSNRPKSGKT